MSSGWELSLGRDESPFVVGMIWSGWQDSLHVVQPETVLRWHRQGFRYY
ncbi:MAG: hypothetical protein OSB26_12825 [Woeseiaceae bacterium]|nr:hypothetical protein [Woeseiaceae bacterium]